jgi:hypothetical protein
MAWEFVAAFQKRTLTKTYFRGIFDSDVQARDAERILRAGVPVYGMVDLGRVPPPFDPDLIPPKATS